MHKHLLTVIDDGSPSVTSLKNLHDKKILFRDIKPGNIMINAHGIIKIADLVFDNNLLLEEGLLIIEHSKHTDLSAHSYYSYQKRYGGNVFSFFEKDTTEEN